MSQITRTTQSQSQQPEITQNALALGDVSKMSASERNNHYMAVCQSLGLNPLTRPLEYLRLNGKELLYARKDATDQLRKLYAVSLEITNRETVGDVYTVTVKARLPDGRCDEDSGSVTIAGLKGDSLANALMKATTKAKRRVTLSVCGMGFLDETEIETIPVTATTPVSKATPPAPRTIAGIADEYGEVLKSEVTVPVPAESVEPYALKGVVMALDACKSTADLNAWLETYRIALADAPEYARINLKQSYKTVKQRIEKKEQAI